MGNLSVIIPAAATNLMANPSVETNATGWTAVLGATLTRVTSQSLWGYAALEIVTPNAAALEGAFQSYASGVASTQYVASIWVFLASGSGGTVKIRLRDATAGTDTSSATVTLSTTKQRIQVAHTTSGAGGAHVLRLYIETTAQQALTFYVDGAQLEAGATATTYVDGDQPGCTWTGTKHGSTSSRSAQSRAGGTIVDIDATYGVKTSVLTGFGMPPLSHNVVGQAILPGAQFQSSKVQPRELVLTIAQRGASVAAFHQKRDSLVEAFKPDRVKGDQPVLLRYDGAGTAVEIACRYLGGLEGELKPGKFERIPARFLAYDPFWYGIGESAAAIDTNDSLAFNFMVARINGQWSNLGNPAMTDPGGGRWVYAFAIGPNSTLYVGGVFLNLDGIANADYIAQRDPVTGAWSALGTGMNTGTVRALAISPGGDLYAGGSFTAAGGVAGTNSIARWDGAAWNLVGAAGIFNLQAIHALSFGLDGVLYAGGDFINVQDANGDRISKWDGSAWSSMGTGALNGIVYALATGLDGSIYAAGSFTQMGGVSNTAYIAKWNGTTWSALGTGLNGEGRALAVAPNGDLYVGGDFTTAGGVSAVSVARWNGSSWSALGAGTDAADMIYAMGIADSGDLYVGGPINTIGGLSNAEGSGRWNGASWARLDGTFGNPTVWGIMAHGNDLYLGTATSTTGYVAGLTTVTNSGSRTAYPKIMVKRDGGTSARLQSIVNETTGDELLFDYALLDGEELTIDLTPGAKRITSSFFGNVLGKVLPNSDFASFSLLPGDNTISAFVSVAGAPTMTCYMLFREPYWSPDGSA